MTSMDFAKPWRLIANFLPLLYAALLIIALPQSWFWFIIVCSAPLLGIVIAGRLEYPFLPLLPTFVGLFLLGACICALLTTETSYAGIPVTGSDFEIWAALTIACGFIIWGVQSIRKIMLS